MKPIAARPTIRAHDALFFSLTCLLSLTGTVLTVCSLLIEKILFYFGAVALALALLSLGFFCFQSEFKLSQAESDFLSLGEKVDSLYEGDLDPSEFPTLSEEAYRVGEKLNRLPHARKRSRSEPGTMDERTFLSYLPSRIRIEPSPCSAFGVYFPLCEEDPSPMLSSIEGMHLGVGRKKTYFYLPDVGNRKEFLLLLDSKLKVPSSVSVLFLPRFCQKEVVCELLEKASLEQGVHDLGSVEGKATPEEIYFSHRFDIEEGIKMAAEAYLDSLNASSCGIVLDGLLLLEARGRGYALSGLYGENIPLNEELIQATRTARVGRFDHPELFGLKELSGCSLYTSPLEIQKANHGFFYVLGERKSLDEEALEGLFGLLKDYLSSRLLGPATIGKRGLEANVPVDFAAEVGEVLGRVDLQ